MKLLVLGATGKTGQQVVARALEQGHEVTIFARTPERLGALASRVRTITGSLPEDGSALGTAMQGQAAVISALGVGKSLQPHGLIAQSVPVIVAAMRGQGVRRLVFMSAYGVGETWRDVPVLPRLLMRLFLREIYADKAAGEAELVRSNLDWTLVHPVTLTDGPLTGCYRTGERLNLRGLPRVPRSEVADFLVRQISDRRYLKKSALIST